jgi:hypothetical protein
MENAVPEEFSFDVKGKIMATESVTSVFLNVLENNRNAGKSLIKAYRAGGTRFIRGVDSRWDRVVDIGGSKLNKKLRSKIHDGSRTVVGFCASRLDTISSNADKALNSVYDRAESVVNGVSSKVDSLDMPYASKYLSFVGTRALPSVKLARTISDKLSDGVESICGRLALRAKAVRKAVPKTTRKSMKRGTARAKSAASA